jgi:hypothetical protein
MINARRLEHVGVEIFNKFAAAVAHVFQADTFQAGQGEVLNLHRWILILGPRS